MAQDFIYKTGTFSTGGWAQAGSSPGFVHQVVFDNLGGQFSDTPVVVISPSVLVVPQPGQNDKLVVAGLQSVNSTGFIAMLNDAVAPPHILTYVAIGPAKKAP